MTKSEREIWLNYSSNCAQIHNLEEFLKNLHLPKESQSDALKAYDDIVNGVKKKIIALNSSVGLMEKAIADMNLKLDSPDFKKNILLVTHHILQDNSLARKNLKQACTNLDRAVDELRDSIFSRSVSNVNKEIFKTKEVYNLVRRHYFGLKKEYAKTLDLKFDLQQKIISPQRALSMAKNIFLHGNLKTLRADLRQYRKDEQRFSKNLSDFNLREKNFRNRDWTVEERQIFLQEKYFIDKQRILLNLESQRLMNLKISLDLKSAEFEQICQLPHSQEKIQNIATGILRKNFKFVRKLDDHESLVSIIADAILREPYALPLVARSIHTDSRLDKDWVWLSEFDIDAIMIKKIIRDL